MLSLYLTKAMTWQRQRLDSDVVVVVVVVVVVLITLVFKLVLTAYSAYSEFIIEINLKQLRVKVTQTQS